MENKIFAILSGEFSASHFIRIGENRHINLYVGKDEYGRYSFDFRGIFKAARTNSSEVISVTHISNGNENYLRFSLENPELLEYFCTFCEDLVESTSVIVDDETAYKTLRSRYFSWKQLFRPNHGNLTEIEVMGLIGELLFLRDEMIPQRGIEAALDSWTGPEKTHKDFSFENDWYEVKTINSGKESVRISSIEQLDGPNRGFLVVYILEKMSPSYNGIKLNVLVNSIISIIKESCHKELFMAKLSLFGFDFSPENDNYVYNLKSCTKYEVEDEFPRIKKETLPESVIKVQYEIILSDLEQFKLS
jgi:hypothetical protein